MQAFNKGTLLEYGLEDIDSSFPERGENTSTDVPVSPQQRQRAPESRHPGEVFLSAVSPWLAPSQTYLSDSSLS